MKQTALTSPPDWLDTQAKTHWKRIARTLLDANILTPATYDLVGSVCSHWSTYLQAQLRLRLDGRVTETPAGGQKASPWVLIEKQAWEMYCRGFKELGIAAKPAQPNSDELTDFLAEVR